MRVTLHVGTPRDLEGAWLEWAAAQEASGPGLIAPATTIVGSRVGSMRLRRLLLTHRQVVVGHRFALLWDVAQEAFASAGPVIRDRDLLRIVATPFRAQLAGLSAHPPGAERAFLQDALGLRLHGVTAARVRRTGHPMARPLALALGLLESVAAHTFDEVRLYHYAAAHLRDKGWGQRVAVYGIVDAHQGQLQLLDAMARAVPVDVFVPTSGSEPDAFLDPWMTRWERHGAQVVHHRSDTRPLVHGVVLAPGAQMADGIRQAIVEGQSRAGRVDQWAVVGRHPERVRDWGEDARRRGLPVRLDGVVNADPQGTAAWAAATPGAPLTAVLLWLGSQGETYSWQDRCQVAAAGWHVKDWPLAIRERVEDLSRIRERLLLASRWTEATEWARQFAEAAGLPPDSEDSDGAAAAALWDRLGLYPSPDSIEEWWADNRQTAAVRDAGTGVLVTDVLRFRGVFSPHVIVPEAVEGRFPGPVVRGGFVDEELARLLNIPGPDVRAVEERYLFHLLTRSAEEVWLVRSADGAWPLEVEVSKQIHAPPFVPEKPVRLPVEDSGSDAGRAGFGPWSGAFVPGSIPVPTSVSGFETYGKCPLRYAFAQLGVKALEGDRADPDSRQVGIWAHAVLERAAADRWEGPLAAHVGQLLQEVMRKMPPPANLSPDSVTALARSLVADLTWLILLRGETPALAVEVPFEISADAGLPGILGRIDRLDRVRGADGTPQVRVVDYKTGTVPAAQVTPTTLQLAVYARAASDLMGIPLDQVRAHYWGIRSGNTFQDKSLPPPTAARWEEARRLMVGMVRRIDAGQGFAYPTKAACRACDYRPACPALVAVEAKERARSHPEFVALWEDGDVQDDD